MSMPGGAAITSPLTHARLCVIAGEDYDFLDARRGDARAFVYALVISIALGVALGLDARLQRFAGDVAEPILVAL